MSDTESELQKAGFYGGDGDVPADAMFSSGGTAVASRAKPVLLVAGDAPRADVPMCEIVVPDDALSRALGEEVYATNWWPAASIYQPEERSVWRYGQGAGGMMIFSRWYPRSRVLLDKFQQLDGNAQRQIADKTAAVEKWNKRKGKKAEKVGYVAIVAEHAYDNRFSEALQEAKEHKAIGLVTGTVV